jgi:hypothetical protein
MKILLIILALLLSSCVTQKRCNKKFPPKEFTRIDSIYIEREIVKYRDTTIYKDLPPVIIEKFTPVKDTLILTGGYSEALCWVFDGNILGTLKEGLKPVKIEYKIKEVEKIVEVERIEYKERVNEVKYTPRWVKVLAYIGSASLLALLIIVIIRIKRLTSIF